MPKELIQAFDERGDGQLPIAVSVTWQRDRDVQLASINMSRQDETEGWYGTLDRHAINRLIRVLRRARDQAYGRDE
jgi:hypothetical protein